MMIVIITIKIRGKIIGLEHELLIGNGGKQRQRGVKHNVHITSGVTSFKTMAQKSYAKKKKYYSLE